jgi:hypothetical protein
MTQQRPDPTIAAWLKSTERWVRRGDEASSASVRFARSLSRCETCASDGDRAVRCSIVTP